MTDRNPVPPETFANALESLDTDALAALVAEAYAATADAVTVTGPQVTATDGDRRTELLAVATADEAATADAVDAVVVADGAPRDGRVPDGVRVVTPTDLRRRLLYAVPPAAANAAARRALGVPMRSETYGRAPASSVEGGRSDDDRDSRAERSDDDRDAHAEDAGVTGADDTAADDTTRTTAADPPRAAGAHVDGGGDRQRSTDARTGDRDRSWTAAAAVVALLLAAGIGAVVAGGIAPSEVGPLGAESDDPAAPSPSGADGGDAASDGDDPTSSDADSTVGPAGGGPSNGSSEAARNTAVAPTCERSALGVVQLQMNAFRYSDDATDDGIRAARAFASPTNKRAVGSVDQFVSLFETPTYAPMLTYDTAEYSVPDVDGDTASVTVVTRENGSVTGRYEFRLERVQSGSAGIDAPSADADECWMTSAVGASAARSGGG